MIQLGCIDLVYCPTDDMAANILTKPLSKWKVSGHSLMLGLHSTLRGSDGIQDTNGIGDALTHSSEVLPLGMPSCLLLTT